MRPLLYKWQEKFLDSSVSQEFKRIVLNKLAHNNRSDLIIDLQEVEFIDSTAMGTLLAINKYCEKENGKICLIVTEKRVISAISLLRINKIIHIVDNLDDAYEYFYSEEK